MARRRSPILWLVAATVVVVVAWFIVTPRRAWQEFLRAVAQDDRISIAAIVDYPTVRLHADEDLTVALAQQTQGKPGVPPRLRSDLMQQMIDSMISPHGLVQMVNGFSTPSASGEPARTSFHYRSLSRVDVLLGGTGADEVGAGLFVFERHGMRWQLVRVSSQRIAALTPGS